MLRKIILVLFLCLTLAGVVFAQNLKVNNQIVHEGDNLNLFFENLEAGKIIFSLEAGNLKKVEITFDKGRNWVEMERQGDYFVYGYRPLGNEVFFPEMLLTDENKAVQTYRPNLRINYQKERPDQQLGQFLEKFKTFYEDENQDRFLSLFSMRYPDRVKFDEAIQNDFYNYNNMRLFYRIDTRAFDDDLEGAIWNVYWQRKYQDRDGNDLTESVANIAMRFDKESGSWLITGLRNNTIFGSSLLVSVATADPDLTVSNITITDPYTTRTVKAKILNNGSASASDVKVRFLFKFGSPPSSSDILDTKTISSINAGLSGETDTVPYTNLGPGTYYFKVIVDPDGEINETIETNNEDSATYIRL